MLKISSLLFISVLINNTFGMATLNINNDLIKSINTKYNKHFIGPTILTCASFLTCAGYYLANMLLYESKSHLPCYLSFAVFCASAGNCIGRFQKLKKLTNHIETSQEETLNISTINGDINKVHNETKAYIFIMSFIIPIISHCITKKISLSLPLLFFLISASSGYSLGFNFLPKDIDNLTII